MKMIDIEQYVNSYMDGLMSIFREYFNADVARKVALELVFLKLIKNNAKNDIFKISRNNFFNKLKGILEGSKEVQEVINDLFRMRDFDNDIMAKTLDYIEKFDEDIPKDKEFRTCINYLYKNVNLNINTTDNLNVLIRELLRNVNYKTIYDPTVGTGMMITEVCRNNKDSIIYGQDVDINLIKICKMLLIIEGREKDTKNIYEGDIITSPLKLHKNELRTFDCIVNNLPFTIKDLEYNYAKEKDDFNRFYKDINIESDEDYKFITNIIKSLNKDGIAIIIEPLPIRFKKSININKILLEDNLIHAVIFLPKKMMYGNKDNANLIIIRKDRKEEEILFIDVRDKGKVLNDITVLEEHTIKEIINVFNEFKEDKIISRLINKNDFLKEISDINLEKSNYIDSHIEKISLNNIKSSIFNIKNELNKIQNELNKL